MGTVAKMTEVSPTPASMLRRPTTLPTHLQGDSLEYPVLGHGDVQEGAVRVLQLVHSRQDLVHLTSQADGDGVLYHCCPVGRIHQCPPAGGDHQVVVGTQFPA